MKRYRPKMFNQLTMIMDYCGVSKKDLAAKICKPLSVVEKICNCEESPDESVAMFISYVLNVHEEYLTGEESLTLLVPLGEKMDKKNVSSREIAIRIVEKKEGSFALKGEDIFFRPKWLIDRLDMAKDKSMLFSVFHAEGIAKELGVPIDSITAQNTWDDKRKKDKLIPEFMSKLEKASPEALLEVFKIIGNLEQVKAMSPFEIKCLIKILSHLEERKKADEELAEKTCEPVSVVEKKCSCRDDAYAPKLCIPCMLDFYLKP